MEREGFSRAGALALAGALAIGACSRQPEAPSYPYSVPPSIDDGWQTQSVEKTGIDRRRLEAMTGSIRARPELNVHAVLIEHDGRLVYEEYFSGSDERWGAPLGVIAFDRARTHDLRSVTKSVVSALVGIAMRDGAIGSLDTPLLDFFPEFTDLQVAERRAITIRHALSMSAGFEWNEEVPYNDPKNDEIVMTRSAEPLHYVLARPIAAKPGTTWKYNGGTTQVLATIVQRATKTPLRDYAHEKLFAPLGISDVEWVGNLAGVPSGASGLRLRPRDLAKFGSLYVHDGQWNGREIVPATWVRESTHRQLTFPFDATRGYAFQWWHACYRTRAGTFDVPTAVGNGDQRVFVLRAQKTVVTMLAGRYNDFRSNPAERLLVDFILPALPRGPEGQDGREGREGREGRDRTSCLS